MSEQTITITSHAPLLSLRRERIRCSCSCGWQTDWYETADEVRLAWERHLAGERR